MSAHEVLTKLAFYTLQRGRMAERGEIGTTATKSQEKLLNQGMAMAYKDIQDFLEAKGVRIVAIN